MDSLLLIFFGVILIIGIFVFVLISTRGRTTSVLDVDKYRTHWLSIEQKLVPDQVNSFTLAVLDADKLLDRALKERGFKGQTMGDRMKSANNQWTYANNVWQAHKLRNRIAHEHGITITYAQARGALTYFRQALKDMGAI